MPRYKVPQNIDMQDRIVGPLTMAQFLYVLVGGMIVYASWFSFDFELFLLVATPVTLLTLALAFLKVQDQPFPKFVASALLYLVHPKERVWLKEPGREHVTIVAKTPSKPEQASGAHTLLSADDLTTLTGVLDSGGRGQAGETEPTPDHQPLATDHQESMVTGQRSKVGDPPQTPQSPEELAATILGEEPPR